MIKIIVVRHGQTEWNVGQVFRGTADVPLNETGKKQAESLAQALSSYKIAAIYSSPLSRARETAEAVAKKWPKIYKLWHEAPHQVKFPKGESLDDVRKRVEKFLERAVLEHQRETIAAVSHRVAIKVLLCAALGIDNSHFWQLKQNTASFSIIEYENGVFSLACLNEICHLKEIAGGLDKVDF